MQGFCIEQFIVFLTPIPAFFQYIDTGNVYLFEHKKLPRKTRLPARPLPDIYLTLTRHLPDLYLTRKRTKSHLKAS